MSIIPNPVPMYVVDHGRCPICWTVIWNEDEAKHMDWHVKLIGAIVEAMEGIGG